MSEIIKDIDMQLLALMTMRDAIDDRLKEVRAQVQGEMFQLNKTFGVKSVDVKLEDKTLASITVVEKKHSFAVQEQTFAKWVLENFPSEVVTVYKVREPFEISFMKSLEVLDDGSVVHTASGMFPDGVTVKPTTNSMMVRFKPDGREAIAALFATRQATIADLWGNVTTPELAAPKSVD